MASTTAPPRREAPPALESGDHLTGEEFDRRYSCRPDIKKAELINGVVYVASPVWIDSHGDPHARLVGALAAYASARLGLRLGDNTSVRFGDGSRVQPGVILRKTKRAGGASRAPRGDYVEGPPELCAEVAASSASYDLHEKKELYRRQGVQEYIVWRTEDEAIDWWELRDGEYVPIPPDSDGKTRSRVFPGLAIDLGALLAAARRAAAEDE
jgi:Uma2 family endonuclease